MAGSQPFASWPEQVAFSTRELHVILGALEQAYDAAAPDSTARNLIRRAQLLIWRKLWPELAEQYQEPDDEVEE